MFTDCYCTQFRRTANTLTRIYDDALRPVGLRITQFTLLRSLGRLNEATVTQLATEAALDRTTMSRNIKLLIDSGWVDVTSADDKREKVLVLNRRGRAKIRAAMPYWMAAQNEFVACAGAFLNATGEAPLLLALETLQRASHEEASET